MAAFFMTIIDDFRRQPQKRNYPKMFRQYQNLDVDDPEKRKQHKNLEGPQH